MNQRSQQIQSLLEAAFEPTYLRIKDESWKHAGHSGAKEHGGGHFVIEIVSSRFAGKSRIDRHRMVNAAVKDLFGPSIHALTIHASSPAGK